MDMTDTPSSTILSQSISSLRISLKDLIIQIINNINSTMPDKHTRVVPDKNISIGDIIAYDPDNTDPDKKFEQTIEEFINDYYNCFFKKTSSDPVKINYNVTHIPYYTIDINNYVSNIDKNITDIKAYIDRFVDVPSRLKLAATASAAATAASEPLDKRSCEDLSSHGGMHKRNSYTRYKDKNSNYTIVRFNFNSKY